MKLRCLLALAALGAAQMGCPGPCDDIACGPSLEIAGTPADFAGPREAQGYSVSAARACGDHGENSVIWVRGGGDVGEVPDMPIERWYATEARPRLAERGVSPANISPYLLYWHCEVVLDGMYAIAIYDWTEADAATLGLGAAMAETGFSALVGVLVMRPESACADIGCD
ncbi:MAG: hypothetical protein KC620_06245 [Myxococcales bacterium]|nr:hypothetical protein [Myxococcales bacterium]